MKALKFRVVLDTNDDVFRDIEVRDDQNFEDFYNEIVASFNFGGGVMSSFYMSNEKWDKGEEITLMDMGEAQTLVMQNSSIREFIQDPRQRIILVYDFMRMWCFLIELIEQREATAVENLPSTVLQFGKSPKEDSKEMSDMSFEDMKFGESDDFIGDENDEDIEDEIGGMFDDLEYDEN